MRVAQVIGKLAAAGVEAVVNNYYCSMNTERIQFDYFIDEDSELAPPQEMIDRGALYFVVPSARHAAARVRALTALFRENHYAIVHAHMNTLNLPVLYAAWRADVPVRISHNHSAAAPEEKARTLLKLMLRPTAGWFATDRMACGEQAAVWMFGKKAVEAGRVTVLPNAIDGIVTGCILAVGRIVGESAALLFTAGFGLILNDFFTSLQSSSATLTVALYVYANERGETGVAFAIATILMILTFLINLTANFAGKKLKK